MLHIEPLLLPFSALLILLLPLPWLFAAVAAAAFHELCHIAALLTFGGKIRRISIGFGKTIIDAHIPDPFTELLSALAGPTGSLLLLLLRKIFPRLAFCGLMQGLFNLIPIYPMDGGRILKILLCLLFPETGAKLFAFTEGLLILFLIIFLLFASFAYSTEAVFLLFPLLILLWRKKPCKQRRIGIQ